MLTEDYFVRMINRMLAAIAHILGLRTAGQFQEAALYIENTLEELFQFRSTIIEDMDDQDLLAVLEDQDSLDIPRVLFAADIFYEKYKLYTAWDSPQRARKSLLRALLFYTEAAIAGIPSEFPSPHEKVNEILAILSQEGQQIPDHLLATLYQYFETTGEFKKAEQYLLDLATFPDWQSEIPNERRTFYRRLLEKTDQELLRGEINRSYLLEQLASL